MAHYDTVDAHETRPSSSTTVTPSTGSSSRWWLWIVAIVIVVGGIWAYRSRTTVANSAPAAGSTAPGAKGAAPRGPGTIPVVVATSTKGNLPVFYNGLGSVTAFNTVTVRSRIDGQLINVAFKEGQTVKAGDLLAEIDPRPYQVQLEQAEGQLAREQKIQDNAEAIDVRALIGPALDLLWRHILRRPGVGAAWAPWRGAIENLG